MASETSPRTRRTPGGAASARPRPASPVTTAEGVHGEAGLPPLVTPGQPGGARGEPPGPGRPHAANGVADGAGAATAGPFAAEDDAEQGPEEAAEEGAEGTGPASAAISPASLVLAGPLLEVIAEVEANLAVLRALVPRSDVPDALGAVAARLRAALREAADADAYVTTDEVARLRGMSRSAVNWRINKNRLRAVWLAGRWRVHRRDVEAM